MSKFRSSFVARRHELAARRSYRRTERELATLSPEARREVEVIALRRAAS